MAHNMATDKELLVLKKKLKSFEKTFMNENGRLPTSQDLTDEVKDWNDRYRKLKSAFQQKREHESAGNSVDSENVDLGNFKARKQAKRSSTAEDFNGVFGRAFDKKPKVRTDEYVLPSMDKLKTWRRKTRRNSVLALKEVPSPSSTTKEELTSEGRSIWEEVVTDKVTSENQPQLTLNKKGTPVIERKVSDQLDNSSKTLTPTTRTVTEVGELYISPDIPVQAPSQPQKQLMHTAALSPTWLDKCMPHLDDLEQHDTCLHEASSSVTSHVTTSVTNHVTTSVTSTVTSSVTAEMSTIEETPSNQRHDLQPSFLELPDPPLSPNDSWSSPPQKSRSVPLNTTPTDNSLLDIYVTSHGHSATGADFLQTLALSRKRRAEDEVEEPAPPEHSNGTSQTSHTKEQLQEDVETKSQEPNSAIRSRSRKQNNEVSQNFVRLNMKVKRFTKKGGCVKFNKWKKWKHGKGKNTCFKCGEKGHWARDCPTSQNLGTFDGEEIQYCDVMDDEDEGNSPAEAEDTGKDEMKEPSLKRVKTDNNVPSRCSEAEGLSGAVVPQDGELVETEKGGSDVTEDPVVPSSEKKKTAKAKGKRKAPKKTAKRIQKKSKDETVSPSPQFDLEHRVAIETPKQNRAVEPIGQDCQKEIRETLKKFGFAEFRPGQREVIERILNGLSVLYVQSTGSGKSLCYQLPAYIYWNRYKAVTMVISPLVSLMEDQVKNLPRGLSGACLHASMDRKERGNVLSNLQAGKYAVLLISPETLTGSGSYTLMNTLPPLAFVCIDEAHCLSQWSHNFRPSYLRICKILRRHFNVKCFLGLTATATKSTTKSVAVHLEVSLEEGVIQGKILPPNLHLSVSSDNNKDTALLKLLQAPPFKSLDSIIIYCTRQQQTERVAQMIRTCMQSLDSHVTPQPVTTSGKKRSTKKPPVELADCYHAGLTPSMRSRVQNRFMSGRLRIVVATVAFGMGLNKSDVRAIIHYNMPRSFESYVQEMGRAGRDGKPAYCHVLLDHHEEDMNELRRHIYGNTVDRFNIKQLINRITPAVQQCNDASREDVKSSFEGTSKSSLSHVNSQVTTLVHSATMPSSPWKSDLSKSLSPSSLLQPSVRTLSWSGCRRHTVAIDIAECVNSTDIKEETLSTFLCYLELQGWIEIGNTETDECTLKIYGGEEQLKRLAQRMPMVAAALVIQHRKDGGSQLEMSFSLAALSEKLNVSLRRVQQEMYSLQWNDHESGDQRQGKSNILTEFSGPAFILHIPCGLAAEDKDEMCDFLYKRVIEQEQSDLKKLILLHSLLKQVAREHSDSEAVNTNLRSVICRYFSDSLDLPHLESVQDIRKRLLPKQDTRLCRDVRMLLSIHDDHHFDARAVARIFHGIPSPRFPANIWGTDRRFWRSHLDVDFNLVKHIAQQEILSFYHN